MCRAQANFSPSWCAGAPVHIPPGGNGVRNPALLPLLGLSSFLRLQDYPKLSQSYYSLLEVLTQDHMNFIASLEPHVIMYILSSISEGLTALGECVRMRFPPPQAGPDLCLASAAAPRPLC